MSVSHGEASSSESDHPAAATLTRAPAVWPLGRMVAVVFVICLATWLAVIAYIVG